jgi:phosphohistidine phosphatase
MDQAAAIPFRRCNGKLEYALVTAIRSGNWGIPKGLIDPGETPTETALKETLEEAGLRGRIIGDSVGTYDYDKWGTTLTVQVFLLEVDQEESDWEERPFRERRWVRAREAMKLLAEHPAAELIARAISDLEKQGSDYT